MLILVVEDEVGVRKVIERCLMIDRHEVYYADSIDETKSLFSKKSFELAILDINLTGKTRVDLIDGQLRSQMNVGQEGFEIASWIQEEFESTRVMFVTDDNRVESRIRGFSIGDDYISKPFNDFEFVTRVRSIERRLKKDLLEEIIIGRWIFNLKKGEIKHIDNESMNPVRLPFSELKVLTCLAEADGAVVSRSKLSKNAFGRPLSAGDRAVDTAVSKIRARIDTEQIGRSSLIETVHGEGYRLKGR